MKPIKKYFTLNNEPYPFYLVGGPTPMKICDKLAKAATPLGFDTPCWLWTGPKGKGGHGRVWMDGKTHLVHRYMYNLYHTGTMPKVLRHQCHNAACCNPSHLLPGTQAQNMQDMVDAGRQAKGEKQGSAKLTNDKVAAVKLLHNIENMSQRRIAAVVGVSQKSIFNVIKGKTWNN